MQLQLNKENFNQTLTRFSTSELENLVEKFPYFQQAHLLLAKKYQQQSNPKFDQQLQIAALYTPDRELLYSIFNEKNAATSFETPVAFREEPKQEITVKEEATVTEPVLEIAEEREEEEKVELAPQVAEEKPVEEIAAAEQETEPVIIPKEGAEETKAEFSVSESHTFEEWLQAFSKTEAPKFEFAQEEIPVETEKQDEELEKLYLTNIPVNLQELVEEETNYSKGLDKFIEEQIQKHRAPTVRMPVYENELAPELITETMAKVYEMQKKYTKAIRCYEILGLKYPEKNDFFAARINYLKNII